MISMELIERARRGSREAEDQIIAECEPMIRAVAKAFAGRGVPFSDLVTVGKWAIVGDVIPRYDPNRGAKLQTYGRDWVSLRIREEVYPSLPFDRTFGRVLKELIKAERRLLEESGEPPSDEQLAQELGWSLEKTRKVREWERSRKKIPLEFVDDRVADPAIRDISTLLVKRTAERLAKKVINRALQHEGAPIRILFGDHKDKELGFFWGSLTEAEIARRLVSGNGLGPTSPGYAAEVRRQGNWLRQGKLRFLQGLQQHRQHRGTVQMERCFGCRVERLLEKEGWPIEDVLEGLADS
jgi:DNA-directed RNA polymerase specialized sigma subunit